MAGHRCVKAREQRYTDTGMARGGSSRKLPEERSVLRRLALALCYLTDRTRNPQCLAELLDVYPTKKFCQTLVQQSWSLLRKKSNVLQQVITCQQWLEQTNNLCVWMKGHREFVFNCKNILSVDCLSKKFSSMLQRCCSTAALQHCIT